MLIVANGPEPAPIVVRHLMEKCAYVVAADGGLRHCLKFDILPDIILGDLDSVDRKNLAAFPPESVKTVKDQNRTDVQKALDYVRKMAPERIHLLAAAGGRTDHALANLFILNAFDGPPLYLWDDYGCFYTLNPGEHVLDISPGKTVSFFAMNSVKDVRLEGFEYQPRQHNLNAGFNGISNRTVQSGPRVVFSSGKLLIYEQKWQEQ